MQATAILQDLLNQQAGDSNSTVPNSIKLGGAEVQNVAKKNWKQIRDTSRYGTDLQDSTGKVFRYVTKVIK